MTPWLFLLAPLAASAADDMCPDTDGWLDGESHLRALSLDLRGVVPAPGEVDLVDGEVPEAVIDAWLSSDAFGQRAARFHRQLLWNNVGHINAMAVQVQLSSRGGVWWTRLRSSLFRGRFDAHCGADPAEFDAEGNLVVRTLADGTLQEGYVWVQPYWDPSTEIKVCAFDAREAQISASGADCSTYAAVSDSTCGCGPELQWCSYVPQHRLTMAAFGEEVDRRVATNVVEGRSWLELLTGNRGFVNGRIAHFMRHRSGVTVGLRFDERAVHPDQLPALDYTDPDWVEIDLGDHHSGVLTSPAFLGRFQTGRARANQFYDSFLCQPFEAPAEGLPTVDEARPTLDLTARDGCKYCHALLEPGAAYWGRWTPFGTGYLPSDTFPAYDPVCAECAAGQVDCSDACSRYYTVTSLAPEQDPFVGWLKAYEFLETRHDANVERGPAFLVEQGLADGRIAACAATKAATWLMGREPLPEEEPWIDEMAQTFVTSGYRWRSLVKAIVTSSPYRSVQ